MNRSLLDIRDLFTQFTTDKGVVRAVDGISFTLEAGQTMGVVGESGCGKTVLALSIIRLIPQPPGKIVSGNIIFNGRDLLRLTEAELRTIRGKEISMIFQEPMTALNPVFRIGNQIAEVYRLHRNLPKKDALRQAVESLRQVGIAAPEKRILDYPHQLSGGMRQRVMLAMAMACQPLLMLADEPTTALDVTIQAQILDLMKELKRQAGMSILLITHDLGVIAEAAQTVGVMYAGVLVEFASVRDLFTNPLHPYTVGLMEAVPKIGTGKEDHKLAAIAGSVPTMISAPRGCRFLDRCVRAMDICVEKEPLMIDVKGSHRVKCWLYG
jgi:peptide/nickel transport system ATP-binding protein/oligopeptide transport system ATP-binding protein